ncbi:GDSL lipase isoform X1 [Lactuca sativa]|uniref:GDSL lipase isoform X1 n=1 Tax=Lactuca sativa TaxID=4236 RepID=UPI000CD85960|nr:GDSL lipase isoform X1 [Lactuca sativa]
MISFRHMAVAKSDLGFRLVVLYLLLLLLTGFQNSQGHFNRHVAFFIFGDSLFDSGNNNYIKTTPEFQANFWPYGESYFDPPSGRFSNGRLIPDFIAEFAGLPLIPAYLDPRYHNNGFLYGANFASGGSGVLVETNAGFVVDLKTQLQYFYDLEKRFRKDLGGLKAQQLLSDAVYLFGCGVNDYAVLLSNNQSSHHHQQYVEMVIGNLTDVFKGILEKGGRKIGIATIPPLGCSPIARAQQLGNTCNEELNTLASLHNRALSKKMKELTKQFEGFMCANYDLSTALAKRMRNPSNYGTRSFKVGDTACCGSGPFRGIFSCGGKRGIQEFELCDNPDDYVFFDAPHPSEAASRQFAQLFWDGDSNVTTPYNLKALFQDHPWIRNAKNALNDSLDETVISRLKQFSHMNTMKKRA